MGKNVEDFFQEGPELANTFETDSLLRAYLTWRCPENVRGQIEPDLTRFGGLCAADYLWLAERAEKQPPRHVPFDAWGRRVDRIEVAPEWELLHEISAREGLVAIAYERAQGAHSRTYQFAKLYLFHPSSAYVTCPLAMTDGAARVLELSGSAEMKSRALAALTSRDPRQAWTAGQWMTERTGGSDVSGSRTVAYEQNAEWRLRGEKWFTSATTSQMALTLARVEDDEKLSLFYVELRDTARRLKNIRIHRLKNKLGTRALPTAELSLEGTPAQMIGARGEGVKRISSLLNITRLYNAVTAVSTMSRGLALAKDYANKRKAFGRALIEQPLHAQVLASWQVEHDAVFLLVFHLVDLLGKEETGNATPEETSLLRLLTPVVKMWSAKQGVACSSEMIEAFGGAGYIEDTGLPRLLRDAQVLTIWEGTTNVMALDVLRVLEKDPGALGVFKTDVERRLALVHADGLRKDVARVRDALGAILIFVTSAKAAGQLESAARSVAVLMARVHAASLLLEMADWAKVSHARPSTMEVAKRFARTLAVATAALPSTEDLDSARVEKILGK